MRRKLFAAVATTVAVAAALVACGGESDSDVLKVGTEGTYPPFSYSEGGKVTGERETDEGVFGLEAALPAVVSVNERIGEARFPSFKGIMAAKKKPVTVLTLAEIGVEADEVGVANASSKVLSSTPKPAKAAGEKITDEGEGGNKIAEYLVGQKLI